MTTTRNEDGTFDIVQWAAAGDVRAPDELERLYWRTLRSTTFGVVRYSRGAIRFFGVWPALISFGPAESGRREIVGGMFARHPYGAIVWSSGPDRTLVALEQFAPRLRGRFFAVEHWFHDIVGRRFLARAAHPCV